MWPRVVRALVEPRAARAARAGRRPGHRPRLLHHLLRPGGDKLEEAYASARKGEFYMFYNLQGLTGRPLCASAGGTSSKSQDQIIADILDGKISAPDNGNHGRLAGELPEVTDDDGSNSVQSEAFSSVSSDSDVFHVEVDSEKTWTTMEDQDMEQVEAIAAMMRSRPLLPPHPKDSSKTWSDVESGIRFPPYHCAFLGCGWTCDEADAEHKLETHVKQKHASQMRMTNFTEVMDY